MKYSNSLGWNKTIKGVSVLQNVLKLIFQLQQHPSGAMPLLIETFCIQRPIF